MSRARFWFKIIVPSAILCIGGPALVIYVSPTPEELFSRYNPELQKRALANRERAAQDYDDFVCRLKELAKSDKPIWMAGAEAEARDKADAIKEQKVVAAAIEKRRDELRRQSRTAR